MQFFYNRTKLTTLIHAEGKSTWLGLPGKLLAIHCSDKNQSPSTLIANDVHGSPVSLHSTSKAQQEVFTPYGFSMRDNPERVGFKAEYCDTTTGFYFLGNGYRIYNSKLMRFHSADTLSPFNEGGINAYTFVSGDPINGSDPSGHSPVFQKGTVHQYYGPVRRVANDVNYFITPSIETPKEINISAHGSPGFIEVNGTDTTAKGFVNLLELSNLPIKDLPINVFACESAKPNKKTKTSFIQDLSNITNQRVNGFKGEIATREKISSPAANGAPYMFRFEVYKENPFKFLSTDHRHFSYKPHTVEPVTTSPSAIRENSK